MSFKLLGFMILFLNSSCFMASSTILRDLIQEEWQLRLNKIKVNTEKFNNLCEMWDQQEKAENNNVFDYEDIRRKASYGKESSKKFYRDLHRELSVNFDAIALGNAQVDVWEAGIVLAERRKKLLARGLEVGIVGLGEAA